MAPITDDIVSDLKGLVQKLESRVQELEAKIAGKPSQASMAETMRMVIMGPPGAG